MINLVLLLIATALVSSQVAFQAKAQISRAQLIDNNFKRNEINSARWRKPIVTKYVKIYQPPPKTVKHVLGTPLVLQCVVVGYPAPVVTWLKNGVIESDFEEMTNEIFSAHPSSIGRMDSKLVINSPSNGDVYTCVGTAGVKEKMASTTVYTDETPGQDISFILNGLPTAPIITEYFVDIMQVMGTTITLPCRVYSTSNSEVYWIDNNDQLIDNESSRVKILPSGDLRITDLVFADMGGYNCTAENMYGKDVISTFLYPYEP